MVRYAGFLVAAIGCLGLPTARRNSARNNIRCTTGRDWGGCPGDGHIAMTGIHRSGDLRPGP